MAVRVLLVIVLFVGLICGKTVDLNLGVIEEGGDVVGVRAHRLSLQCTPTHPAQVEWTHNNSPIPKGDLRRYVDENGSLVITKVVHNKKKGESDAGTYQCKVSNSNGAILSSPIKLAVAGISHEFVVNPSNQTVIEGNLMRLSCSIESTPKANISWVKDGEPLMHNKRIVVTDNELFITNTKLEDGGSYQCNASNTLVSKVRLSSVAEVTVIRSAIQPVAFLLPEPHLGSNLIKFRLGEKGFLICAASGIPRPNVKWISNRPDGANLTYNTTYNGLNIFTIERVAEDDRGVYACNATQNTNGLISAISRVLNVDVEVPPVIIDKPKSQVFPAAKTVRIECGVRGFPVPQVVWYKDGLKLHINGRIKQRPKELVLGGVVTQDTGIYQCFASSPAGVAWAAGRLVVNSSIDQPAPPSGLKCKTLSAMQVSLAWNQLIKSDLRAFSVHYFPTEGGDEGKDVALNDTYVVGKLQPHTNYTFYIRSYSGKSASEQSKRVVCKTAEAVPIGAPQLSSVVATSSHCVTIEWSPPPLALARGTIVNYKVQWKKSSQTSAYFDIVSGNTFKFVIPGLRGGLDYLVRVVGATSSGWPELSENQAPWVKMSTPHEKSSALQSPSVQLYYVNSSKIEVLWNYGDDIVIDGFKIDYRNSIDEVVFKDSVPANVRIYSIPVLAPSKWYDVSVRAYRGSSDDETCLIRYDLERLPTSKPTLAVPTDLDVVPLSQQSVNVTWSSPPHLRSPSSFRVYFTPMYPVNRKAAPHVLTTNQSYAVITNLKARTYYRIFVQASTADGEMSSLSGSIECKTLPEVLGPVDNIEWRITSDSSVELRWDPLSVPVTGYTVFYSARVIAESDDQWQQIFVTYNKTNVKLVDLRSNMDYVVRIRGESGNIHGPLSADTFISLPPGRFSSNGHTHPKNVVPTDQFLGILVGISISICCIALCTGSLLYRKKCIKLQAQVPSSFSENGHCSVQCERSSMVSIEMKELQSTSPINGMKLPLITNGNLPNGGNREKLVRITDNPQGRRGERSSSHSTDEGDSLLSGPETEMETEEPTQITLLVDSSLLVVSPCKETAPDDGFHETHVSV